MIYIGKKEFNKSQWETIQLRIPNSKKLYLARSPPHSHVFLKCLPMYIKAQKMTNSWSSHE